MTVSIHARTRRATDVDRRRRRAHRSFNPRPHAAGDADLRLGAATVSSVSIHARTRRATRRSLHSDPPAMMFQSTPARGGRPVTARLGRSARKFQSTPARGGRRPGLRRMRTLGRCFNPRPHAAGDSGLEITDFAMTSFRMAARPFAGPAVCAAPAHARVRCPPRHHDHVVQGEGRETQRQGRATVPSTPRDVPARGRARWHPGRSGRAESAGAALVGGAGASGPVPFDRRVAVGSAGVGAAVPVAGAAVRSTDYVETRRVHNIVPFVSVDGGRYGVPPDVLGQLVETAARSTLASSRFAAPASSSSPTTSPSTRAQTSSGSPSIAPPPRPSCWRHARLPTAAIFISSPHPPPKRCGSSWSSATATSTSTPPTWTPATGSAVNSHDRRALRADQGRSRLPAPRRRRHHVRRSRRTSPDEELDAHRVPGPARRRASHRLPRPPPRSPTSLCPIPYRRRLTDFDFEFQPSVERKLVEDLATLRFIDENRPILFLGHRAAARHTSPSCWRPSPSRPATAATSPPPMSCAKPSSAPTRRRPRHEAKDLHRPDRARHR